MAQATAQIGVTGLGVMGRNRGAGDGNRTRMTSLEGWSSTIELRPQQPPDNAADTGSVPSPARPTVMSAPDSPALVA